MQLLHNYKLLWRRRKSFQKVLLKNNCFSLYLSKFYIVQEIVVYNNGYITFATMYYTILSSFYHSTSSPRKRGCWVYIDQLFENSVSPVVAVNWIRNELNSESIKVSKQYQSFIEIKLFVFSVEPSQFSKFHEKESKLN